MIKSLLIALKKLAAILIAASFFSCSNEPKDNTALSFDNNPIFYEVTGKGPLTLIFVHGLGADHSYWDSQKSFFKDKYQVVTLDLAGHGASGKVRKNWTPENYSKDVMAVMNELQSENIVLIGHDMGDEIILRASRTTPNKMLGMIGVDNFKSIDIVNEDSLRKAEDRFFNIMQKSYKLGAEFYVAEYLFSPYSNPRIIKKVIGDMQNLKPAVGIGTLEYLFKDTKSEKTFLRNITAPLYLINSDYAYTDTAALKKYCFYGYDITYIRNIGHYPMLEAPSKLNNALAQYLMRIENRHIRKKK